MDQKLVNEKEMRYNKEVLRNDLALEHLWALLAINEEYEYISKIGRKLIKFI